MADFAKIGQLLLFLLFCTYPSSATTTTESSHIETESKEELVQSESKDGKLEIIKQIKKVNDDGSYTIGYEADDGSFKIESRDVLGNIKGTYGYIDDAGEIKRVSYSTSNSSEVLSSKPESQSSTSSVVQRIPPKTNRTLPSFPTNRPSNAIYSSTTISTPSSTPRLRSGFAVTTTEKPNYSEIVNMDNEAAKTTSKPNNVVYSSTPRVLLQGRPILRSTPASPLQKSEGQLIRPEVTARPTELPLFRRLALKHPLLGEEKQVSQEPERSNILRRQLAPEKVQNFDPQQHVFTLQQSLGADSTDVYSASVTTGTPRPLFTTTLRPRALLSTSAPATVVSRPTIRYPSNFQRTVLADLESNTQEYVQESTTTTEASVSEASTPTPVPIVQIPANRPPQEPLVAIKHPYQRGAILVPLSQIQGRVHPFENVREYGEQSEYQRETTTLRPVPQEVDQPRPIYVRRLPPPQFRPIPVHVDENGYIRDVQQPASPYPLPVPVSVTPAAQKYVNNDVDNDIDEISPPVSTRDFQKLLQQLIMRQTRLERISALTDSRREYYHQPTRYRQVYRPTTMPYFVQRETQQTGPVQFMQEEQLPQRQRHFIRQQQIASQRQNAEQELYNQSPQSYTPTRRVARLLPANEEHHHHQMQPARRQQSNDEYLPPDVREMLLLRMLQLAINPALPLDDDEMGQQRQQQYNEVTQATTPVPQYKKVPVRNVEILGEESEEEVKRPAMRNKRYREYEMDYYDQ